MRDSRLPLRLIVVLLVNSALTQALTFVRRPTISYRALELDVPTAWLGGVGGQLRTSTSRAGGAVRTCSRPLGRTVGDARWRERHPRRRPVVVFLGESVRGLILGSVLLGIGHLGLMISQQATVANTVRPGSFDTAFGYYTFAASLGQSLGPGLIGLIGGDRLIPDTGRIFLAATFMAVVLVGCTLLLPTASHHVAAKGTVTQDGRVVDLLRIPGLARAPLTSCVVLAAVDITLVYQPALGEDRGLNPV
jgi:hypothetical protein